MAALASEFPNDNFALHRGVIWVCVEPTGRAEAMRAAAPKRASLAPPEDDQEDASAAPIVIEELDPVDVEVSLEGDVVVASSEPRQSEVTSFEPEVVEAPVPAASGVVLAGTTTEVEDASSSSLPPVFEEVTTNDAARSGRGALEGRSPSNDNEVVAHDSTTLPSAPDDPFTVLVCTLADVAIGAGSPHVASLLPGLLVDGRLPELLDQETSEALRVAGIWDGTTVTPAFMGVATAWRAILRGTSDDFDACGAAMLDEWSSDLLARLLAAPAKAPSLRQELRNRGIAAFGLAA